MEWLTEYNEDYQNGISGSGSFLVDRELCRMGDDVSCLKNRKCAKFVWSFRRTFVWNSN